MMALVSSALLAFSPAAPVFSSQTGSASAVSMSLARRSVVGTFAAAVAAAPFAALADGASSPTVRGRARAIYGSRVYRLQDASVDKIIEEKNVFTLFTTGAYRADAATKDTKAKLGALSKTALAAAKKGDTAAAQAAVKEFVKVGDITVLDDIQDSIFNPKQRRNAGAPTTDTVEAQMGSMKYAFYQPLPDKK